MIIKTAFLCLCTLGYINATAQNADPGLNILTVPGVLAPSQMGRIQVTTGNFANDGFQANSVRITLSAPIDAEILGFDATNTSTRWTILSLTSGLGNTIRLMNVAPFGSFDLEDVWIKIQAAPVPSPNAIYSGNIVYIAGTNPLVTGCDGIGPCPNAWQGNATTPNDNSGSSLTVLPITLSSFNVNLRECKALLSWATSSEHNVSFVEVQSGTDGEVFSTIGKVQLENSPFGATYSYAVNQEAAKAFYRLKFVDIDGKYSYSPIRTLIADCHVETLKLYPSMVSASLSTVMLTGTLNYKGNALAEVTGTDGRLVCAQNIILDGHSFTANIPVGKLAKGMYNVRLSDGKGQQLGTTQKFVKQ